MRKSTRSQIEARTFELLDIRLDGATFEDCRRYVAEQEQAGKGPWKIPEAQKPLSVRTIWRYLQRADQMVKRECSATRKKKIMWARERRNRIYSRALAAADYRTALAALIDMARLDGLYPDKDAEIRAQLDELHRRLDEYESERFPPPATGQPVPAPAGLDKRAEFVDN